MTSDSGDCRLRLSQRGMIRVATMPTAKKSSRILFSTAPSSSRRLTGQRAAGEDAADRLAVGNHLRSGDEHVPEADARLGGPLVARPVLDGRGIEDHDVRVGALLEPA